MTPKAVPFTDRRFPALNAVRAIGALMVVCTHAAFNTGEINRGWHGAALARLDFGVTLFFILSGFLLSRPFLVARTAEQRHPSVRHYLWKRALRILPLYWVVVVVALLADPANRGADWKVWLTHLTLTEIYPTRLLASSLTQMWSLCTEVAFYVLLPVIVWLVTVGRGHTLDVRRVLTRSAVLSVLGIAWQAWSGTVPGSEGHFGQWLPGYLPWFLAGLCLAAISADATVHGRWTRLDRWATDLPGCWLLGVAVFAIACSPIAGPRLLLVPGAWEAGTKAVLYTVAGVALVLPLVFGPENDGRVRRFLSSPVPFFLGEISYGIFAIHMFVLIGLFRWLDLKIFTGHFEMVLALTLLITVVAATVSFYGLERPFLRWKNIRPMVRLEPEGTTSEPTSNPAAVNDHA